MNTTQTLLANANRLGHGAHVAAFAISLITKVEARALCCWCAEGVEGEATRLRAGGECSRCPYAGRDCLVIVPPVVEKLSPGYYLRREAAPHAKAVNGDRVPMHGCSAGPADPACCFQCGERLRSTDSARPNRV